MAGDCIIGRHIGTGGSHNLLDYGKLEELLDFLP
jgi:hypothetical protein